MAGAVAVFDKSQARYLLISLLPLGTAAVSVAIQGNLIVQACLKKDIFLYVECIHHAAAIRLHR